jgi:alpha-amylase/alpha-mannosidase (GH57 family)
MATERDPRRPRTNGGDRPGRGHVCIHGHFYQPPRENPWLEEIELQDSAYPYHDWNERIADECYASNAASRILDESGFITRITSNYARMSFDFGPTLLAWLQRRRPEILRAIVDADLRSRERFSGHGSAMAQTYNHIIQPLASSRDRRTQVVWGLRDFEHRFGRRSQGMWLPETAVDIDSLEALAENDVRFTLLAPHQAATVRRIGDKAWQPVDDANPLDTGMPYSVPLPSGRSISVFFYDGPVSRAIAFDNLLHSGKELTDRLLRPLHGPFDRPRLMHVATDGETYGHHHRFGDMALAFALAAVEASDDARLTNYAQFLDQQPPTHEATVVADTSWSCAHGIERWRADCGCRIDPRAGWSQAWRGPLRETLDWLRDQLSPLFERRGRSYLQDPWRARDSYIDVVLDRSAESVAAFLAEHAHRELDAEDRVCVLELLEMQRHAMLMYTSCGWFFDDVAGIETIQVLRYAGRAIQLAERRGAVRLEEEFVRRLDAVHSNRPEEGSGADIYRRHVEPTRADLRKVGAHYAISSLFNGYGGRDEVFCYRVEQLDYDRRGTGRVRIATGRCRVTSSITQEAEVQAFAVVHLGDHNLAAGVRDAPDGEAFQEIVAALAAAFDAGNLPACMNLLEKHFGPSLYALPSLFRDQRRAVLSAIVDAAVADVEASARRLYDQHAPLLQFLPTPDHPLSRALRVSSELTLTADVRKALAPGATNLERVAEILAQSERWDIGIDRQMIAFEMERSAAAIAEQLVDCSRGRTLMSLLGQLVELARRYAVDVNLWRIQNAFYRFMQRCFAEQSRLAADGSDAAAEWVERAHALGEVLRVRVE